MHLFISSAKIHGVIILNGGQYLFWWFRNNGPEVNVCLTADRNFKNRKRLCGTPTYSSNQTVVAHGYIHDYWYYLASHTIHKTLDDCCVVARVDTRVRHTRNVRVGLYRHCLVSVLSRHVLEHLP